MLPENPAQNPVLIHARGCNRQQEDIRTPALVRASEEAQKLRVLVRIRLFREP